MTNVAFSRIANRRKIAGSNEQFRRSFSFSEIYAFVISAHNSSVIRRNFETFACTRSCRLSTHAIFIF